MNKFFWVSSWAVAAVITVFTSGARASTMVEVEHRPLKTTVMRQEAGLVTDQAAGALVLFGGTGAKSKAYGIAASMAPIANKAVRLGFSPVAFQNPLYFDDHLNDQERARRVGNLRTTDAQVEWLNDCVGDVLKPLGAGRRLILAGRSTGSSLILEGLHRYLATGARADVFGRVEHVLIMGPVDPRPAEYARWFKIEHDYLSKLTDVFDAFAHGATDDLFGNMRHAADFADRAHVPVPDVTFVSGFNDVLSTLDEQIDFATAFQRLHPRVAVRVVATDTSHNPAASVEYRGTDGETVKVRSMKRLSPLLKQLLTEPTRLPPGLTIDVQPEAAHAVGCGRDLGGAA